MPPKTAVKGLADMRTIGGQPGEGRLLPHKLHMRLCCLEMERHRRDQERKNLLARAGRCEDRCNQIDVEVKALMAQLAASGYHGVVAASTGRMSPVKSARAVGTAASTSFTHRY